MFTRTSPAAGRAREPCDVAIKYFKQQKKKTPVTRGFLCVVPRVGLGSFPGAGDPLGVPGWNGERAGRSLRELRDGDGAKNLPAGEEAAPSCRQGGGRRALEQLGGWQRRVPSAPCQPSSLLCSSASAFFRTKAGKRQRGVGTQLRLLPPEVTTAGSCLGTAQGAAGAPLRGLTPQGTELAATVAAAARAVRPGAKVPPGFSS